MYSVKNGSNERQSMHTADSVRPMTVLKSKPKIEPPNTKEGRRQRIIQAARQLMGDHGFEALSLRKLAEAANVTVPTIYNLIGSKEKILIELIRSWIDQVEEALDRIDENQPLKLAEAVITEAVGLIAQDESYFRAAHLALQHLKQAGHMREDLDLFAEKATAMQARAVGLAQQQGLLRGDISAETLGRHIYHNYSVASQGWAYGTHDLAEFRLIALTGVYLHFLSDATEEFRPQILSKLQKLS